MRKTLTAKVAVMRNLKRRNDQLLDFAKLESFSLHVDGIVRSILTSNQGKLSAFIRFQLPKHTIAYQSFQVVAMITPPRP